MTIARTPFVGTLILCALSLSCSTGNSEQTQASDGTALGTKQSEVAFSTDNLKKHIRYLASDELEGRAPGSKGEELTLSYLAEQYSALGLRPGNPEGLFVQEVPLVGTTVRNRPQLGIASDNGSFDLAYQDDFMGWTLRRENTVSVDNAELVFVGYGIVAPEYGWNDYKDLDVTGKILVMLVGDPPLADKTLFAGKAMTYYGRWTYKYEIAAEKGAAGVLIIHNTAAAGYPWEVVSNSWFGEQFDIVRKNKGADRCRLEAWVTESSARNIFETASLDLDTMNNAALSKDFRPVVMPVRASVTIENDFRELRSYNVVALVEGHDPAYKDEVIIYTAHWDHLGVGNPVDGDSIYNGALDNASGVAATLEIARAFAANSDRLKRSVLFINTTAEESGLLGSYHYADNPLHPLDKTVATINIDGLNIWGPTTDMVVVGYGQSNLDVYLERAIEVQGRVVKPDAEPEKGYYYRSDHFPFAKKGVPSLYSDSGVEYRHRPGGWGLEVRKAYTSERYHKPQDNFGDNWDLRGAVEDIEALFRVGMMLATDMEYPQWSDASEFKQIREASSQGGK